MSFELEKFHKAIMTLCGEGEKRERLIDAYLFCIIHIKAENLPKSIQQEFNKLENNLNYIEPSEGEGRVQATVNSMTAEELDNCISKIIEIHENLIRTEV
ncbi:MAG: hypothetical protein KKE17_08190 [Proteobacteria bacterium]|nr:hypothetical protein [Pseudomonadota bacterium]MBU1709966.1 hypothetical protein [Pseudomonadota bacterium]